MKRLSSSTDGPLSGRGLSWRAGTWIVVVLAGGCQSAGFRAARLPQEYRAAHKTQQSALNLTRMAGAGIGNTQLAHGDLLEVTVTTGREDETPTPQLARIAGDGSVNLPLIGPVHIVNLEPFEASQRIASAGIERGIYRRPHVTVDVKTRATSKITVLGAVTSPGTYEIPRGACDLAAAIGAAGGLTEEASREVDVLRHASTFLAQGNPSFAPPGDGVRLASLPGSARPATSGGPRMTRIDLASAQGVAAGERHLNDGDVVMALPRDEEVIHVTGLVVAPGQFDLPHDQDVHLLDAIALAGGSRSPVGDRVLIIRRMPDRPAPLMIRASLLKAKSDGAENIRLMSGDTVSIERTPATVVVDTFNQLFRLSFGLSSRATVF